MQYKTYIQSIVLCDSERGTLSQKALNMTDIFKKNPQRNNRAYTGQGVCKLRCDEEICIV
jgi:hypothetical protein